MSDSESYRDWSEKLVPDNLKTPPEFTQAIESEIERLSAEKSAWEDRLFKTFLPMELYQAGREGKRLQRIKRWLENEGFEIREVPAENLTQFCRKGKVLAEFKIEFKK